VARLKTGQIRVIDVGEGLDCHIVTCNMKQRITSSKSQVARSNFIPAGLAAPRLLLAVVLLLQHRSAVDTITMRGSRACNARTIDTVLSVQQSSTTITRIVSVRCGCC
jgi:hypothetical protein